MLKQFKLGKHLEIILVEMCSRISIKLSTIDILKDGWQEEHEWTIEEEIDFQNWMFKYLIANHDAVLEISDYKPDESFGTQDLMTLVKEFTLLYGWALKSEADLEDIIENKPKTKK